MHSLTLCFALFLSACVTTSATVCSDGRVCPAGTMCESSRGLCVIPEQLDACSGATDNAECTFKNRSGVCNGGVCLEVICGDGIRTAAEECDGADLGPATVTCALLGYYDDLGPVTCSSRCTFDTSSCARFCGDQVVDTDNNELCDAQPGVAVGDCSDYGYYVSAPVGCSNRCLPETSGCVGFCGDGTLNGDEACELGVSIPSGTCIDYGYDAGQIACSGLCTPEFTDCVGIGWKRIHALSDALDMWPVGPRDFVVADYNDGLVRITDGVKTVILNGGNKLPSMYGVWAAGADDIWAVGANGQLAHFDGTTWSFSTAPGGSARLNAVWGTSSSSVYAVGRDRIIHYNGSTWTPIAHPFDSNYLNITNVWASGSDLFVVGAAAFSTQIAHYNGSSWSVYTPSRFVRGLWGSTPTNVWAVGDLGAIYHYTGTWTTVSSPTTNQALSVWGRGEDLFVGVFGAAGSFLHYDGVTTWLALAPVGSRAARAIRNIGDELFAITGRDLLQFSGASWSAVQQPPGIDTTMDGTFGTAPDDVFVLTADGLYRWTSSGIVAVPGAPTQFLTDVWSGGGSIFVSDLNGDVHHFNGVSWSQAVNNLYFPLRLWGNGPNDVYAAGSNTVRHYTGTWATESPGISGIEAVWGDATATYVVGAATSTTGAISRRASNGTWTPQVLPAGTPRLYGVWGTSANDVFAVGVDGAILHYDGVSWTAMESPAVDLLLGVAGFGPSNVFAAGDGGTVVHYNGTTWSPVRTGTFEPFRFLAARGDRVLLGVGQRSVEQLVIPGPW